MTDCLDLAKRLAATLPAGRSDLFNPYADASADDATPNAPATRLARLACHLAGEPKYLAVGEAPGYAGARVSGVAFTSEKLLMQGAIPRVPPVCARLTTRPLPFSEPSATIVWKALYRLGIAESVILWNAVMLHPHRAGEPHTNRTPTPAEIALGIPAMEILRKAFPSAKVIAIGRKAEGLLTAMGVPVAGAVRHPANGGATQFAADLAALVRPSVQTVGADA